MTAPADPKPASPGLRMALDFGPLVLFFAVNFLVRGDPVARAIDATVAFMVATLIALVLSWWKLRHVSPMLWITCILVFGFGGLTIYFHDPRFIKMKPTFVYALFALALLFGLITRKPVLEQLLGTAYPGLDPVGWRKLTRNWAVFFVAMAVLNEIVWRNVSTDWWATFKVFGAIPLTIVFAAANIPMLLRHGLVLEDKDKPAEALPPEG